MVLGNFRCGIKSHLVPFGPEKDFPVPFDPASAGPDGWG